MHPRCAIAVRCTPLLHTGGAYCAAGPGDARVDCTVNVPSLQSVHCCAKELSRGHEKVTKKSRKVTNFSIILQLFCIEMLEWHILCQRSCCGNWKFTDTAKCRLLWRQIRKHVVTHARTATVVFNFRYTTSFACQSSLITIWCQTWMTYSPKLWPVLASALRL